MIVDRPDSSHKFEQTHLQYLQIVRANPENSLLPYLHEYLYECSADTTRV